MKTVICDTHTIQIWMAGNVCQAKQVCRQYCLAIGLCVTVTPTEFVYTGGEETGFVVGLLNYPRFPTTPDELLSKARELAEKLRSHLCQHSYLIVSGDKTEWSSCRKDGQN